MTHDEPGVPDETSALTRPHPSEDLAPAPLRADDIPARAGSLAPPQDEEQIVPPFIDDNVPGRAGERRDDADQKGGD